MNQITSCRGDCSHSSPAQRHLSKLPNAIASRIKDKLLELKGDPRPPGCKKLRGRDAWRIRIGDYYNGPIK